MHEKLQLPLSYAVSVALEKTSPALLNGKPSKYGGLKRHIAAISEFIINTNQKLGSEIENKERLAKKRKFECKYCYGIFNQQSITKHEVNCELYQKLTVNEKQCRVCKKIFVTRQALNSHIGHHHKDALLKLPKSAVKFTYNELKIGH